MKAIGSIVVLLLLVFSNDAGAQQMNSNLDFSGVEKFFIIHDVLINDVEPTLVQWDDLFLTPGYYELVKREIPDLVFRDYFRAAYMPSKSERRTQLVENSKKAKSWFWRWFPESFLASLDYAHKHKERLLETLGSFRNTDYCLQAKQILSEFLPGELLHGELPEVAFIVFNDSRGYKPVIMSISEIDRRLHELTDVQLKRLAAAGFEPETAVVYYLAHEFYHQYRERALQFYWSKEDSWETVLLGILDRVQNEGTADMINVLSLYAPGRPLSDSEYGQQVAEEQAGVAESIRTFDDACTKLFLKKLDEASACKQMQNAVKRSGHPVGYFMARHIAEARGLEILKKIAGNPFDFISCYAEVSGGNPELPGLNSETLQLIAKLREKYQKE